MKKWGRGTIVVILIMVLMLSSTGMAQAWWGWGPLYQLGIDSLKCEKCTEKQEKQLLKEYQKSLSKEQLNDLKEQKKLQKEW